MKQGGKRIRPVFTLLVSRLFGMEKPSPEVIDVAAGIELIHMATLLHDDIIDEAPLRRHQPSAYRQFGLAPSLLAGDFLLVRAFGLCARLDDFVVEETERACIELTEGEVLETKLSISSPKTIEDYVTIVGKKTASLFLLSAKLGAHLAGAERSAVQQMANFGYYAGIAFQVIDDILDITAEEDLLGKPAGTDLRQKTPSLLNILWLQSEDPHARAFFEKEAPTLEESKLAATQLKNSPLIHYAQTFALNYANKANAELTQIQGELNGAAKNQLFALVEYTLERAL